MPIKKISGMEAMDRAERYLAEVEGDRDDAVARVRRYERGRVRQDTIIRAIDLLDDRATVEFMRRKFGVSPERKP
jgi:hypothetical protein